MYATINIKVTEEVKEALDKLKLHRREPYHEVIAKLIDVYTMMQKYKEDTTRPVEDDIDYDPAELVNLLKGVFERL